MKIILQRVKCASVTVDDAVVGKIQNGYCLLVGIHKNDSHVSMDKIISKILSLRLFPNESGDAWKLSLTDLNYEILCVSQFTLFANIDKGAKPDFHNSMKGEYARPIFDEFVQKLRNAYDHSKIQTGAFGEYMQVEIINDGPVTIELDSNCKNVK